MLSRDQMGNKSNFHPTIIALKDKEGIREIVLDKPYIRDKQPVWISDYPILCYLR